jgi:hypothetical protein
MLATNWTDYFMSRLDNEKGNQNTTVYSSAWDPATTTDTKLSLLTRLSLLTSDPDTIIFGANAEGTIIPLHSFANLGGSLLRPDDKFVCLIGSGQGGIAVIVDPKSATKRCSFVAPPHDVIIAKKTTAELHTIPDPTATDPNSGTKTLAVPPFSQPLGWWIPSYLQNPTTHGT